MNCLDFRRQLMADPTTHDSVLLDHEDNCAGCASFAREVRAQEAALRSVLLEPTPPAGLDDRIRLAARLERRNAANSRWWYAAAASVLLLIGASMASLWTTAVQRSDESLAQAVLNHIDDEASHLRTAHAVSRERVKWVFQRFGAELAGDIGQVNFAAECLMRHRNGVHLVLPGQMGPVTVFFMPGEMTDDIIQVESTRFVGQVLPTHWGSIAVVGELGEPLDGLGQRLASAVRWPDPGLASSAVSGPLIATVDGAQQEDG
ncbi:MAG: DUF3379 family protein [Chromatiaceae bacterium]|nr:DUF3379 family protein [Gammaproteobacteria bacterium]MCP5304808.1 DUF3379 family protein [Chromatiaceae bacterium]MCP5314767.1 DUF3379 family protein [Chromatiaceae bacterium]